MTLIQIILVAVVPVAMIAYGVRTRKRGTAPGRFRLSFMSRRTVKTPEAWTYAHSLFSKLMMVVGINVLMCGEAFYLAVRFIKDYTGWICPVTLMLVQLAGVLFCYLFTSLMVRRSFDMDGELIDPYKEEEDEAEDTEAEAAEGPEGPESWDDIDDN